MLASGLFGFSLLLPPCIYRLVSMPSERARLMTRLYRPPSPSPRPCPPRGIRHGLVEQSGWGSDSDGVGWWGGEPPAAVMGRWLPLIAQERRQRCVTGVSSSYSIGSVHMGAPPPPHSLLTHSLIRSLALCLFRVLPGQARCDGDKRHRKSWA